MSAKEKDLDQLLKAIKEVLKRTTELVVEEFVDFMEKFDIYDINEDFGTEITIAGQIKETQFSSMAQKLLNLSNSSTFILYFILVMMKVKAGNLHLFSIF